MKNTPREDTASQCQPTLPTKEIVIMHKCMENVYGCFTESGVVNKANVVRVKVSLTLRLILEEYI